METVNSELVGQITTLVQAWNTADRQIRDLFHGWEQRAARAGLERGFYVQLATLPGADAVIDGEIEEMETAGRAVYAAYRAGGVTAALDEARGSCSSVSPWLLTPGISTSWPRNHDQAGA